MPVTPKRRAVEGLVTRLGRGGSSPLQRVHESRSVERLPPFWGLALAAASDCSRSDGWIEDDRLPYRRLGPGGPIPLDAAELDEWLDAQRRERRPGVHLSVVRELLNEDVLPSRLECPLGC